MDPEPPHPGHGADLCDSTNPQHLQVHLEEVLGPDRSRPRADLPSPDQRGRLGGIRLLETRPASTQSARVLHACSLLVGIALVALAAVRGVYPGLGTVVQVVVVGATVSVLIDPLDSPEGFIPRLLLLAAAFPVVALGIVVYLGSHTGAGPAEAAALAWDPPVAFRWSYSAVQGGGALVGWLLGATIGLGTVALIVLLGQGVTLVSRVLRLDVHRRPLQDRRGVVESEA